MGKCKKCIDKYGDLMYLVARLLVGFMFFSHGAQKLFGWFGGTANGFSGLIGAAGVIEFVVGLTLLLGLWTRLMASLGALLMLVAYFMAHSGNGWHPLVNGGELALLYLAVFLVMAIKGNGKWSLESKILGKEKF